jgi:hypothetical protein
MQKNWFTNLSILLTFILVVPEICLYVVAVLARVEGWVDTIGWYAFTSKLIGIDVDFYLGLEGYVAEAGSTSTFTSYSDSSASFASGCEDTGFRALIMSGIAVIISIVSLIVNIVRHRSDEDSYLRQWISFTLAFVSFALGVASYVYFYIDCINEFFSYLDGIGYTNIRGLSQPGGACEIAAIICGIMIALLNFTEVLAAYCCCGFREKGPAEPYYVPAGEKIDSNSKV